MIGEGVFIIAEIGVNHNGNIDIAKEMVDSAKEAGADAVKFQTFKAENLVTREAKMAKYQVENIKKESSQFEMLKKLELSFDDFKELYDYCKKMDIKFISTPFDFESAKFLIDIGVDIIKISSGDLTNHPLIEYILDFNLPLILSTGMSNIDEIEEIMSIINNKHNNYICLMHCTSNYPASYESVNLRCIETINKKFQVDCGYSDHTLGKDVAIAAVALGAKVIEKHFTLDKSMSGPDHSVSLNPHEFKDMVESIRNVEKFLGNGIKRCTPEEFDTRKLARKSIVCKRDLDIGEVITLSDLEYKRPGDGIPPSRYREVINKRCKKRILKDYKISFDDIE